jgi:beta-barrel assembly-enhancing protease
MKKNLILISLFLFLSCSGSRKVGTLNFVTLDEELALGRELVIQTPKQFRVIRNQEITQFFTNLAKEIAAISDWSGLNYTVFILNEADINHFSLPGGEVYITRGLIEMAGSGTEVAAAIAHEIAHIGRRDGTNRLAIKYSYALAAQSVIGQNPELAIQVLNNVYNSSTVLDYQEEVEYSADAQAVKYLWKANYDPNGLAMLIQNIRRAEKDNPRLVERSRLTHPPTLNRLNRLRKELADAPPHSGLRTEIDNFKTIQEQLQRIPR